MDGARRRQRGVCRLPGPRARGRFAGRAAAISSVKFAWPWMSPWFSCRRRTRVRWTGDPGGRGAARWVAGTPRQAGLRGGRLAKAAAAGVVPRWLETDRRGARKGVREGWTVRAGHRLFGNVLATSRRRPMNTRGLEVAARHRPPNQDRGPAGRAPQPSTPWQRTPGNCGTRPRAD